MKAWQFTAFGEPLALHQVPDPTPSPDEVVIDIKAAGLCHSDVGVLKDEDFPLPAKASLPVTLGHEIAGVISEVGANVRGWAVGDRVGIGLVGTAIPGIFRDGGYAEKITSSADVLIPIPDSVTFEQAAVGTDAGMTAHGAVIGVGQVKRGDKVGIIGLGGLGQIGTRVAVLAGCDVYVAEVKPELWPLAKELGATRVVGDVRDLADEELDVIIDLAGFETTFTGAIETIRAGGRVVLAGMGASEATVNTHLMIMKEVTIVANLGGTLNDTRHVYELMSTGDLQPITAVIPFGDIPEGLHRLSEGEVIGRLVAKIAN